MDLYTKNGLPLQVHSGKVYSKNGNILGRIKGKKVYGTDGNYVGTIVGDRLVYRSTDSSTIISPFSASDRGASEKANRSVAAILGDEPKIRN